jgi:hypothetical protein
MDAKEVKKGRSKGSCERKAFSYEFSQIRFASHEADLFRATVSSVAEGVLIWLESKKTKQQWQAIITNVGECGPSGVPEEAVVAFLKVKHNFHSRLSAAAKKLYFVYFIK